MGEINNDDFYRLHNEFVTLKEKHCTMEDLMAKIKKEFANTKKLLSTVEAERNHLSYIIKSSKKAVEMENFIKENIYLKSKIKEQDEDFRLQNSTLLQELSRVCIENEILEERLKSSTNNSIKSSDEASVSKDVVVLQGELAHAKEKLLSLESNNNTAVSLLREKIHALSQQNSYLLGVIKENCIALNDGEIQVSEGGGVSYRKVTVSDEERFEAELCSSSKNKQLAGSQGWLMETLTVERDKALLYSNTTQSLLDEQNAILKEKEATLLNYKILFEKQNSEFEGIKRKCSFLEESLGMTKHELENKIAYYEEKEKHSCCEKLNLENKLAELLKQHNCTQEKLSSLSDENAELQEKIKEFTQISDKRVSIIQEMNEHVKEEKNKYTKVVNSLEESHRLQVATANEQKNNYEARIKVMKQSLANVAKMEEEFKALQEKHRDKESNFVDLQIKFDEERDLWRNENLKIKADLEKEMVDLQVKLDEQKKEYLMQLEICNIQKQELEDVLECHRRQLNDSEDEKKIYERKAMTLMKDLKKQLSQEKKRADHLQEKLSQLLSDPDQLHMIISLPEKSDDVSSVSSWSMVSGEPKDSSTYENSVLASPQSSPSPDSVNDETANLVCRVAELQQEKWQLEERISHLESSSAAMAEDLMKKSAIINHYCMDLTVQEVRALLKKDLFETEMYNLDSQTSSNVSQSNSFLDSLHSIDKTGVFKVLDILREVRKPEESVKEVNRRLHCLLEETLAKNMQLHHDIANLTQKVHNLSLITARNANNKS